MISLSDNELCVQMFYEGRKKNLVLLGAYNIRFELENLRKQLQYLVYLASTIFRSLYPHIIYLTLIDYGSLTCDLPDGKQHAISMKESYFLLYGKTLYEDLFDAVPYREEDVCTMNTLRNHLTDPSKKPERFNFLNTTLTPFLEELYTSSSSWSDFFNAIQYKWGNKALSVIYTWYQHVLSLTIPLSWKINVQTLPRIDFKAIPTSSMDTRTYYPMEGGWDGGVALSADWTAFLRT